MSIKLLPESVANQIAAGEVVQRPASVVKELMENSIDSGASNITLVVKDAGKSLIQVIDDGLGMSEIDAELSLKRHATSKIASLDDLFRLKTMGFRGEALASIVAVSQFEMKTRRQEDEVGCVVEVDGKALTKQFDQQAKPGTSVSVKNLFYNVPARRNFLKSDNVENRHIAEAFQQIALCHPSVAFRYFMNGKEVHRLSSSNFKQRIVQMFGKKFDQRLVPLSEKTELVNISGFIGKPEFANTKRSEQYFIVNQRFIKSPYLHHAVMQAYEELVSKENTPQYFIRLEVDPDQIDVNVHPTKTEIKFIEERSIYAILRTIVRQSLGKFNIAPSLDFERESVFDQSFDSKRSITVPVIKVDPKYNPFETKSPAQNPKDQFSEISELLDTSQVDLTIGKAADTVHPSLINESDEAEIAGRSKIIQLHNKFILTHIKSGFMVIDQNRAHQRILYDRLRKNSGQINCQQLLFPIALDLNPSEMILLEGIRTEVEELGFSFDAIGKDSLAINGVPTGCKEKEAGQIMMDLIEDVSENRSNEQKDLKNKLALKLAKSMAVKAGVRLDEKEMESLVDRLFACEMPYSLPGEKPIIVTIPLEELNNRFNY